ncbi:MAG: peptide ABC transporter substrate-binding protein [Steroidobacteraceae bacterium]|jgi:oligopeptide transport system substrate-binding protein
MTQIARAPTFILTTFLVALAGCGPSNDHPLTGGGGAVLRRGLSGEPSSLDPAVGSDNFSTEVMQDLYEGLTSESPTGQTMPAVASSWTVDASGKQYTFHLRADARWSNGRPVRAAEFVAAWRRVVDPKHGSPVADDLRLIAGAASIIKGEAPINSLGVAAPSDDILIVTLEQPTPYLPQVLTHSSTFPIFSEESASSHGGSSWVSNGPYILTSWRAGANLQLSRNTAYWDRANARIKQVEYEFTSDDTAQYARYRAGQLDLTDDVPSNAIPSLREARSTELVIAPFLATAYYGLNLAANPMAGNPKLRQALTLAIDRQKLVTSLGFGQAPAFGFIPPGVWNYEQQSFPWKTYSDADRNAEARRLYAEAGYTAQSPLRLRLLYNSNVVIKQTAILIAAMWKETLGIDTDLNGEEYRVFLQSRHDTTRWDVARLGWTADYNDASNFLDIFRQKSVNNDEHYINPKVDALLDSAAANADPMQRRHTLEAAERLVLADYPVIPLYHFVSKRLVKPYVSGVHPNPLNGVPSKALSIQPH